MATTFKDIRAALEAQLAAYQASNVDYENSTYTPPNASTAWLRAVLVMDKSEAAGSGDTAKNVQRGTFLVDVMEPVDGGTTTSMTKIDGLVSQFKRGTDLTSGTVTLSTERAWPGQARDETVATFNWYVTPVSIGFVAYTDNA